ncbi:MAG: hypothetical protein EPN30_00145 [Actinomycetota bacterium]|nr:MAG: hypothetical protein EPN30_00145 [Actinomycetota bacterium]
MLVVMVIILIGILVLHQSPHKPSASTTNTTIKPSQSTTSTIPAPQEDYLQVSTGPTWVHLDTTQSLTLDTSSLAGQNGIAVSLELFSKIQSRSEFQVIMKYGLKSLPIASSPPVDLNRLSHDAAGKPLLNFELSETAPSRPLLNQPVPTSFIQIPYCSPNCSGVYPLLAVFVQGSQIIGTALTDIALEPSSQVSSPLNFAFVVQAPFTGNSVNDLNSLSLLVSAVSANPSANITLNIPGMVLQEAEASHSSTVKSTLDQLLSWSQKPGHQIINSGFVPVNLPQLRSSGLNTSISEELVAGRNQTEQFLHQHLTSLGPLAVHGGLTFQNADTLASLGASDIMLSDKYFVPFSEKFSLSQPFALATSVGKNLTVLADDSGLKADISSRSQPYRDANQLSTDLAQIYFDQPNDTSPRVVGTLFQVSNSQDAQVLTQILTDVSSSPFIKTVSLNKAFALTSADQLSYGKLATPAPYLAFDPTRFNSLTNDIAALTSSLGQNSDLTGAQYNLLASLSSTLSPKNSNRFLNLSQAVVNNVSSKVSLASNKAFTVTARSVHLPIAITSQFKVPFKGILVITSDRLSFPNGNTIPVTLNGPNTTISIPIYAETLGLYLITAKLFTTNGQFAVANTSIEIRSTAFSAVSIVLTLGAFLVLGLWWIQSFRRGHRRNRRLVREKN